MSEREEKERTKLRGFAALRFLFPSPPPLRTLFLSLSAPFPKRAVSFTSTSTPHPPPISFLSSSALFQFTSSFSSSPTPGIDLLREGGRWGREVGKEESTKMRKML